MPLERKYARLGLGHQFAGDVRSLQNVKPDFQWFGTAHHEMGHVFYFLSYDRPGNPMVLREARVRRFMRRWPKRSHADDPVAVLAAGWSRAGGLKFDETQWLLNSALDQIVFMPGRRE